MPFDLLTPESAPVPAEPTPLTSAPASPVAPAATRQRDPLVTGVILLVTAFALVMGGLTFYVKVLHPGLNTPAATHDPKIVALGRAFVPELGAACASGFEAAGQALALGKTMTDAQTAQQAVFLQARTIALTQHITPELAKLIADGTEPTTDAQRIAVAKFFTDLATGLKGSK